MKRLIASASGEPLYLKVYLTNLGKYNEGDLVGNWVDVDGNTDWDSELEAIGVSNEPNEFGEYYEEYFITDYDSNIPDISSELGEYPSLDKLDEIGSAIQDVDADVLSAMLDAGVCSDIFDAIKTISEGNYMFAPDVNNEDDLGYHYVENIYGDANDIPKDILERYFDYEGFGRDIAIEGFYDEELDEETEHMSDQELGEYCIEDLGYEYDPRYFDYEAYGRDISIESNSGFTPYGYIEVY